MWKRAQLPDYEYAVFTMCIVKPSPDIRNLSIYGLVKNAVIGNLV